MEVIYSIEIISDDFKKPQHEEIVSKDDLQQRLSEIVPECNIDFERIFNDKRCKYYRHYMPENKTVAKTSYKENNDLFNKGNRTRVYISERLF